MPYSPRVPQSSNSQATKAGSSARKGRSLAPGRAIHFPVIVDGLSSPCTFSLPRISLRETSRGAHHVVYIVLFFVPVSFFSAVARNQFQRSLIHHLHTRLSSCLSLSPFSPSWKSSRTQFNTPGHTRTTLGRERVPANTRPLDKSKKTDAVQTRLPDWSQLRERVRFPSRSARNPPPPPVQHCTAPCVPPPARPRSIPPPTAYKQSSPPLRSMLLVDLRPGARDRASSPVSSHVDLQRENTERYCISFLE